MQARPGPGTPPRQAGGRLQSVAAWAVVLPAGSRDLRSWLAGRTGCPEVTHTLVAACPDPGHGSEEATWFYVEADGAHQVARRRCVGCGTVVATLDSAQRWSFPRMYACETCGQSMVEFGVGLHATPGPGGARVDWLRVALRCVGCGSINSVTDMSVPDLPLAQVAALV